MTDDLLERSKQYSKRRGRPITQLICDAWEKALLDAEEREKEEALARRLLERENFVPAVAKRSVKKRAPPSDDRFYGSALPTDVIVVGDIPDDGD